MNDTNTDPRKAYIARLADVWKAPPDDDNNDEDDGSDTSSPPHGDGYDDPRAAYIQRLTGDGVPYFGDRRMNDSRVVRLYDGVDIPTRPTLPTVGAALRICREQRHRMFLGGAA
jgi:hypothetical protein